MKIQKKKIFFFFFGGGGGWVMVDVNRKVKFCENSFFFFGGGGGGVGLEGVRMDVNEE